MAKISIIIPSRLKSYKDNGIEKLFVSRAIQSIRAQQLSRALHVEIRVGVDPGAQIPEVLVSEGVIFAEAGSTSQAAALNAAAKHLSSDYLGILEDDDQWAPGFLEVAMGALDDADFVSSTQLEVMDGEVLRVNDYPNPSGWIMKTETWESVGEFDESYRWHLDCEWLGRLAESKRPRVHLVEATAPVVLRAAAQVRPSLTYVVRNGGPSLRLVRHSSPWPLVTRFLHLGSGIRQITTDPEAKAQSENERSLLRQRFGRLPS